MYKKVLICCLIHFSILICDIEMVTIERNERQFNAALDQQILSRRRRYLTFPEGSSLQLGSYSSKLLEILDKLGFPYEGNWAKNMNMHFEVFGIIRLFTRIESNFSHSLQFI